jgi:hypothetical protein
MARFGQAELLADLGELGTADGGQHLLPHAGAAGGTLRERRRWV